MWSGRVDSKGGHFFVLAVLIRILMDWNYSFIISKLYNYAGFTSDSNITSMLFSWVMFFLLMSLAKPVYMDSDRLSAKVMLLLFLMAVVPFTTMVAYRACSFTFSVWNFIYVTSLFVSYHLAKKARLITIQTKKRLAGNTLIVLITIVFSLTIVYVSGIYTHFRFHFSLSDVYDLRAEAANFNLPWILIYLFSWARALIPICLALFLREKNYIMIATCILTQLLSFGIDGSKSPLVLTICVIIIYFLPNNLIKRINKYALCGLCMVLVTTFLQYLLTGNYYLCSLIVRRVFFIPVLLETCYFDFFQDKMPDFFRGSFLRHLGFQTPYPDLPKTIGAIYFSLPGMNCNNGLFSDAFGNLGYLGLFLMPPLIAIVMRYLDKCSSDLDPRIYLSVSIFIAISLVNTNLFTALLTHGILVIILLLSNIKRDEQAEDFRCSKE